MARERHLRLVCDEGDFEESDEKAAGCARTIDSIDEMADCSAGMLRRLAVMRHARHCPECAVYWRRVSAVVEALEALEREGAPAGLVDLVMDRLLAGAGPEACVAERRSRTRLFAVAGAAGMAVAAAVAYAVWRRVTSHEPDDGLGPVGSATV